MAEVQPPLFPGYEPTVICICDHPDPPPHCEDPADPKWCQHVRFRPHPPESGVRRYRLG